MQDERQFRVVHDDGFGCVQRLRLGCGYDHRHRFADMAHTIGRQQHMRAGEHRAAAWPGELHVVFGLGHRIVRNRPKIFRSAIGAGEDAEHAGHVLCRGDVDRDNPRMRMRRSHHRRIGLAVETEIVGEAALAGDEPLVLFARQRLTDEAIPLRSSGVVHRILPLGLRMILSENRVPLFGIISLGLRMILSENRFPLFGIMRWFVHATRLNSCWRRRSRCSSTSTPSPGCSGTSTWPLLMARGAAVTSSAIPLLVTVRPQAIAGATAARYTAAAEARLVSPVLHDTLTCMSHAAHSRLAANRLESPPSLIALRLTPRAALRSW